MDPTGATPGERTLRLEAGAARVVVRPDEGGRLGSLVVGGHEVLWTSDPQGPIHWGSYPMAPWAGRVRDGRFTFAGRAHQLPLGMPPHAIHGVVYDRPWEVLGPDRLGIELDERWPFRGRAEQRFALDEDGLAMTLLIEADEPMPASLGWHPWFRRSLGEGIEPVRLRFEPGTMLVRDGTGMPSGERVPPTQGPWDDAFTDVAQPPVLEWGDTLRLEVSSTCRWWVVYTEPAHALCVEPQSAPPDALNGPADVVEPGTPLVHEMRWRWERG
jgi:aldose 1-epimerase